MKKVFSILLLIVFFLEIIGFTLVRHRCLMAETNRITSVNGFSDDDGEGCCCSEEPGGCSNSQHQEDQSFNPQPCCTRVATYLKMDLQATGPVQLEFTCSGMEEAIFSLKENLHEAAISLCLTHPFYRFHSPPLAGTKFLYANHSLKIPSPGHFHVTG